MTTQFLSEGEKGAKSPTGTRQVLGASDAPIISRIQADILAVHEREAQISEEERRAWILNDILFGRGANNYFDDEWSED